MNAALDSQYYSYKEGGVKQVVKKRQNKGKLPRKKGAGYEMLFEDMPHYEVLGTSLRGLSITQ